MSYHRRLWVSRDAKYREKYVRVELKKITLRALMANLSDSFENRCYYAEVFSKIPRRYSISYFRTHCLRTGTGRSVFRSFKYGRHELKRLSGKGLIAGLRKSSF